MKKTEITTTQNEENFLKGIEDVLNIPLNVGQEIKILSLLEVLKSDLNNTTKTAPSTPVNDKQEQTETVEGFTAGNWYGKDGQIYPEETGKTLALIPYFDANNEEQKANQLLISQAPNLYRDNAQLKELLQWIVNEIETTPDELSDALLGMIKIKSNQLLNLINK